MAPPPPHEETAGDDRRDDARAADQDIVADDGEQVASAFPHPPWTVGLVLVAGVITLLFGILVNPVWLLVGSPFVLALLLWLYIKLFVR